MSGHSKWSKIKRGKAITDAKRGKVFSKYVKMISVAAREKGGDPKTNPTLRMVIEKARSENMPYENIERAIKKGTGEIEGARMENFTYEAYAPGGIALIIEGITDNKNRTLSEIKHMISTLGGKFAESGSVSYLFQKKGVVTINNEKKEISKEDLELAAIEAGAEDIKWMDENILEIYTKPEELDSIKKSLEENGAAIDSSSLDWVAASEIEVSDEKTKAQVEKLMDALDEHDDVNEIYSNLIT
jgi:YebC/PmpR family DNA-binding regulatory protein